MKPETKKPLSKQQYARYTDRDTDQFSTLVYKCQQPLSLLDDSDNKTPIDNNHQFEYTQRDNAAFDKLMHLKSRAYGDADCENKNIQHYPGAKTCDGYTSTDDKLFSELTSFETNPAVNQEAQKVELTAPRGATYSDTDQLNFDRLNPLSDSQQENQTRPIEAARDILAGKNDRDIGVVKIIEYDKLKSERSNTKDRPNENIKIRFFD